MWTSRRNHHGVLLLILLQTLGAIEQRLLSGLSGSSGKDCCYDFSLGIMLKIMRCVRTSCEQNIFFDSENEGKRMIEEDTNGVVWHYAA